MKTRRQSAWLTAIAVAGSVALYGCGGGSSPDTTPYDQAAVDKAAQDAAATTQAAVEARAVAIATAEAAQAEAEQAAMDAATAASDAADAATMAADNAMAGSIDVAAATSASMDAETASTAAETASTAAEAASARAAAVTHDDPAVAAAKTAAAAAAMEAGMSAGNAAASAAAAAASVSVAMQLEVQADAGGDKTAMDTRNARLATEHATRASRYADRAGEAAEAVRALAEGVMGGSDPDIAAARALEDAARHWEGEARKAKGLADGIPAEGNEVVARAQATAMTAVDNAAASLNRAMGATIAVQGYVDRDTVTTGSQAIADTYTQIGWMQDIVSWIVGADEDDVSSAAENADAAADLAPRLAEDALAEGGHDSEVTMARVAEMSGLTGENAQIMTRLDPIHTAAALDYDSAVPLFERGRMNVPGAEVTSVDDLATGGIVRAGVDGVNTDAFTVNGHTLQSVKTISERNALDYIGSRKIVSAADPVYVNNVLVGSRAQVVEFDRWNTGKSYEYITFGFWAAATDLAPTTSNTQRPWIALPYIDFDRPGAVDDDVTSGFLGGDFVFADRDMLWKRTDGGGVSARYNGSHITATYRDSTIDRPGNHGRLHESPLSLVVDFDTSTIAATFSWQSLSGDPPNEVITTSELYRISGIELNDDSTLSAGDNTAVDGFGLAVWIPGGADILSSDINVSGGIFGPNGEEIAGSVFVHFKTSGTPDDFYLSTAFGGRHQSYQ